MSISFGEDEWAPFNSEQDDWDCFENGEGFLRVPLGLCNSWGSVGGDLYFDVQGSGDSRWMSHVFETLAALEHPFLAGINRCPDMFNPASGPVLQFCVIMEEEVVAAVLPRVERAYEIAMSLIA